MSVPPSANAARATVPGAIDPAGARATTWPSGQAKIYGRTADDQGGVVAFAWGAVAVVEGAADRVGQGRERRCWRRVSIRQLRYSAGPGAG
ncbi:hypothetical protein AB0C12_12890 [Actinoplanes sp. NPDC048967]|uniref:hypothetical protein n=1 Tax=Actinoplanes sp. NPDC048967 TaxID=3155269 RepID=UPI0033E6C12A